MASPLHDALFHDLIAAYSEPHRKYHTTQHVDERFDRLADLRDEAMHPAEVEPALWFHDAIYDTKRQDNEARSAERARDIVLRAGLPLSTAERAHALILATRHDAVPNEMDEKILVDVDLSILAAKAERFDEYERQARGVLLGSGADIPLETQSHPRGIAEAADDIQYREFVAVYEARARENLRRSVANLAT